MKQRAYTKQYEESEIRKLQNVIGYDVKRINQNKFEICAMIDTATNHDNKSRFIEWQRDANTQVMYLELRKAAQKYGILFSRKKGGIFMDYVEKMQFRQLKLTIVFVDNKETTYLAENIDVTNEFMDNQHLTSFSVGITESAKTGFYEKLKKRKGYFRFSLKNENGETLFEQQKGPIQIYIKKNQSNDKKQSSEKNVVGHTLQMVDDDEEDEEPHSFVTRSQTRLPQDWQHNQQSVDDPPLFFDDNNPKMSQQIMETKFVSSQFEYCHNNVNLEELQQMAVPFEILFDNTKLAPLPNIPTMSKDELDNLLNLY